MKKDTINYFMVGSFIAAMLILLLYGLYRITGQTVGAVEYLVVFDNVQGIKDGAAVTYSGYPVGQVDSLKPVNENNRTRYLITLNIRRDWRIPADSSAQIVKPGLISDQQIEITQGSSEHKLKPGDTINSREAVDMMALMNSLGSELDGFLPAVTGDVRGLLQKLNQSADQLNQILSDKNRQHMDSMFANADRSSQHLTRLASGFDKVNLQLEQLLQQSSTLMTDNGKDIRVAVTELRKAMLIISSNMDSILYNLGSSSRNMNEFTRQLRDNPGALLGSKPPADTAESHK
ncbi:MAG: MlaD family protein [Gammaproteobacteria bacterium]|nr:MlaD family protein [Gammaproteobacteria bacterium]